MVPFWLDIRNAFLTGAGGSIICSIVVNGKTFSATATGADQDCTVLLSPNLFGNSWSAS